MIRLFLKKVWSEIKQSPTSKTTPSPGAVNRNNSPEDALKLSEDVTSEAEAGVEFQQTAPVEKSSEVKYTETVELSNKNHGDRWSFRALTTSVRESLKSKLGAVSNQPSEGVTQLPIRIIIGYLPEVSERDAREYAQGMAEKHFEQMGIAYFDAYEYGNGYAFEAHEGGNGRAYLPQILERFDAQGPYQVGETIAVVIKTATRLVEVQRVREGLAAILLPEASRTEPTEDLNPTARMVPGLNRLTAFFYSGVALMASGTLAVLLSGTIFRVQTFKDAPPQKIEKVQISNLPRTQWNKIESLPPGSYVRAIRYRNNKWEAPEIITDAPAPPAAPAEVVKVPAEEVKK